MANDGSAAKRQRLDSQYIQVDYNLLDTGFPTFRQPTVIGEFSLDKNRGFCPDNSQMKYISWPSGSSISDGDSVTVQFDLKENINQAHRKLDGELDERLDNLLKWILKNQMKFALPNNSGPITCLSTDIICYRGLMTKLMATPYEQRDPWIICATLWRGTIYLCKFETEHQRREVLHRGRRQQDMCSWGYKFEQYMMSDEPGGRPDTSSAVVENEEFCCVLRSRLGRSSVVFGAEVDGVDPKYRGDDPGSMARFVELKTSRLVETPRQRTNLHRKMCRWWAQSFLVGIDRLLVGYRDDDGVVHKLQAYSTHRLPKLQDMWKPNVCMNFLDGFLRFAVRECVKDDPRVVYKFYFCPRKRTVSCTALGRTAPEYRILPEWYTDAMFSS